MPKTSTWIDPRIVDEMMERSRMVAASQRNVRYHLRLYADHLESRGVPFEDAGADDVLLFYDEMRASYSSSTASQALNPVKRLHRWVSEGEVEKAGKDVAVPSRAPGKGMRKALSPAEARLVMAACETDRDAALIGVLMEGALKPCEARAANVADVAFLEDCAVVLVNASDSRPESVLRLPKPPADKLKRCLDARKPRSSDEPLFASESTRSFGARLSDRSIREIVQRVFSRAGIPGTAGGYDMRKTALLLAREAGADDEDLVRFARLRSMATVRDADGQYRYASDGPQERLSRALAGFEPEERSCLMTASAVRDLLEGFGDEDPVIMSIDKLGRLAVEGV